MTIKAANGWEFEVQPIQDNSEMEVPFRLVRANGRPPYNGQAFRLFRNKPNPEMCFPVPEKGFASKAIAKLWFRVTEQGVRPVQ
jgi:hypothetical protein